MRSSEALLEPGAVVAGRYKVLGSLGRGGMGIVYEVEHVHTHERLALKVLLASARLDPQAIARFKREARTSTRIKNDHVVRVIDADTAPELDGSPFLVMELLDGTDLEKHVASRGALSPAATVAVLAQVASALEAAHRIGIVHRDLKPENLFLHRRSDGTSIAKVLDFGISKIVSADGTMETAGKTSAGAVVGTPFYMAPEQAHGENDKIDSSTDVWAMGLVAIRLLTAGDYWNASSMADLMMKLAVKPILPPSQRWPDAPRMSAELDAWFLRSCHRDQKERWPSVVEQVNALAAALGGVAIGPIPSMTSVEVRPDEGNALAATVEAEVEPLPPQQTERDSMALAQSRATPTPSRVAPRTWALLALGAVAVVGVVRFVPFQSSARSTGSFTAPVPPSQSAPIVADVRSSILASGPSVVTPATSDSTESSARAVGEQRAANRIPTLPPRASTARATERQGEPPAPRPSASAPGIWTER